MNGNRAQYLYEWFFSLSFCVLPLLCMLPKIAGVLPAVAGVLLLISYFPAYRQRPLITKSIMMWIAALVMLAALSCFWAVNPNALRSAVGIGGVLIPAGLFLGLSMSVPQGVMLRVSR